MIPEGNDSRSSIEDSIERAKDWVLSRMHPEGWFPFAQVQESSVKGSWCTAQAMTALMLTGDKKIMPATEKTVSWLNDQNTGKGWRTMVFGEPLIESTTWVLLAMLQVQEIGLVTETISRSLGNGIHWLLDCQNLDGGWGSWKNDLSRTTTSSLACRVLLREGSHEKALRKALTYLKITQNSDGGWGFRKGEKSNIVGSSMALAALSEISLDREPIELGCEFVESEQNAKGTFAADLFIHETIAKEDGILRWEYFHLPLALHSLAVSGKTNSITLFKGLSRLLELQQSSGAWINSNEPQICYHTYVTLYYLTQISKLLDTERFLEFQKIMKDYRDQERKYRILAQKNQLHHEIVQKALIIGKEFKLASGKQSNYYYNLKDLVLDPKTVILIANLIWEMSADIQADAIGGPETGAIPIAIAVAEKSLGSEMPLRAFFIRREPKGHGTRAFIEGPLRKGDRVMLVDDVTTTGGSIVKSIDRVKELGCEVVRIYSVVDREEGVFENIGEYASVFQPLFKHSEVKELVL